VRRFNEAQEEKRRIEIQAINDQERCPIETASTPNPDLERKESTIGTEDPQYQKERISLPALKYPGLGTMKDILFKRESF